MVIAGIIFVAVIVIIRLAIYFDEKSKERFRQLDCEFQKKNDDLNIQRRNLQKQVDFVESEKKSMIRKKEETDRNCDNKKREVDRLIQKEKESFSEEIAKLRTEKDSLLQEISNKESELAGIANRVYDSITKQTALIIDKCSETYPRIAAASADLKLINFDYAARFLEVKERPAFAEAKRIRELKKQTKDILVEKKLYEYKYNYIVELFPNVEDIFEDGFEESEKDFELETEADTDRTRLFLSSEEYQKLSVAERNQLALDRYLQGKKTKWQIGRDYEMFIGFQYEKEGAKVSYCGIIKKLEDMGRDLIVEQGDRILIVQCKNWSQEKEIHEKHIFQLYGTVVLYQLSHRWKEVSGVFVTSTSLSRTAKDVARYLHIETVENKKLEDFPRIKCNINRTTKEKIYHLPFDQKYDDVIIEPSRGEFFAKTVAEAEEKGFRRAMKYFGE